MPRLPAFLGLLGVGLVLVPQPAATQDSARLAAYQDIVWSDDSPEEPSVLLDGDWFDLLSVDGHEVPDIIDTALTVFGDNWRKRFDEDLVEVLAAMGGPPGQTVMLGLRDPESGEELDREASMTSANRQALMEAKWARAGIPTPTPGTVITVSTVRGVVTTSVASAQTSLITPEEIDQDLDALVSEMEGRWAYLRTTGVDYRQAIDAVRERAADGMSRYEYGREVMRIIALFVDGHSRVGGVTRPLGELPFFIEPAGDRFVAIRPDRSDFWDPDFPFVTHIDDRPLEDWLEAAAAFVPKSSPQWLLRNSLRLVGEVQFVREAMGLERSDAVAVRMSSSDGQAREYFVMADASSGAGPWPQTQSGIIDGDVGYLRLAAMDAAAVREVETWMPRFRETRGLVVDVRGNGGGSRDALRALFPFLMAEGDAPRVSNAARYRLSPMFSEDHLGGSRYMYRESWPGWSLEERAAIEAFKETFTPEWMPPDEEFSEWHYLVLSRDMNPRAYTYGKPVVVLLDENSFSATDIFVSALKGWHDVTLVGTPSGGGSARQVATRLPVSGLSVNLASMASFQWTGRLHDGNGTQPDVLVRPAPEYYLRGGVDNVLDRALELLP